MEENKLNKGAPDATGGVAKFTVIELHDGTISIPNWIPIFLLFLAVVLGLVFWRRRRRNIP
jgi:hypothetical protein